MEPINIATINYELNRIACRNIIAESSAILAAHWITDKQAEDFVTIGADQVLTFKEERNATPQERNAYHLWRCTKATGISHDSLTLVDVLMWFYEHEDDEDESVTMDEIVEFIGDPVKCLA